MLRPWGKRMLGFDADQAVLAQDWSKGKVGSGGRERCWRDRGARLGRVIEATSEIMAVSLGVGLTFRRVV